jgi:hypothetical protein
MAHIMPWHIYLIQNSGLPATLSMSSLGYNGITEGLPSWLPQQLELLQNTVPTNTSNVWCTSSGIINNTFLSFLSMHSLPTPRVLTTLIIKQHAPVKHRLISWGTLKMWHVPLKFCTSTGLALHPRCLFFIVTTARTHNPVSHNKDPTENCKIH